MEDSTLDLALDKPSNLENEESFMDNSMICDAGSCLIQSGFTMPNCTVAGGTYPPEIDSSIKFMEDSYYEGGDIFETDDPITDAGDFPFIYQSARVGNFHYRFENMSPGEYYVDLHFMEFININGPKGMRVFNVFIQDDLVLSEFDVFSMVGANKPLQVVDSRISVKDDGLILVRFEGVTGSPLVSGICIRRASALPVGETEPEDLVCGFCAAKVELPKSEKKAMQLKSTAKYEQKIKELNILCQTKTEECYQAWMSFTSTNEQLQKVNMELDNLSFRTYSLDQTVEKQTEELKNISKKYENNKKMLSLAANNLEEKIKTMKEENSQLSREAHACVDSIPELNKMVSAIHSLVEQCEDLKRKYSEEQTKRKKLYNEVQEAKGNIRVFCRCRPLSKTEIGAGHQTVIDFDAAKDGELGITNGGSSSKKIFKFDRVYTPKEDQLDVFADALPMVTSVLDGYNVCIFAYGQTGTGKTFTMEGTEENRGVNYRTLEELFKIAHERRELFSYDISVSVLEVYNEQIRDLLAPSPSSKKLEIKQDLEGAHHVPGLVEARVVNTKEVWDVLQAGTNARAVESNNVNEHSSRSHCMLCIMVKSRNLLNGEQTKSKLWLVDLAGSERLAKTDAQGDRLKEAQNINKSLSALGDVIFALANKNSTHIPYRNSKLTQLLQDSLGGDSKTLMFVQISPSEHDSSETTSSLNFATRVRGVEMGPVRKQIDTSEIQKLRTMLDKAKQDLRIKEEVVRKLEENRLNVENMSRGKERVQKCQQEKIKELEAQIELKIALQNQSEKHATHLFDSLRDREELCSDLQHKIKVLEKSDSDTKLQVRDLENKLKDQERESQSRIVLFQEKIEELEMKLKDKQESVDSALHQKIKELEDKLRDQEQQQFASKATHLEEKENHIGTSSIPVNRRLSQDSKRFNQDLKRLSQDSINGDSKQLNILRNSNLLSLNNRRGSCQGSGSSLLKGNEVQMRRLSRNSETENSHVKSFARSTRIVSKSNLATNQRPVAAIPIRINREPVVQGQLKKDNTKKRVWS
ncbi:kinesin-like protein KIN-14R isoform X2 [Impatiens glandulifera]|uniref:kinesin-like protein KIN-14R isoform X2 n=1 Tax=Impatiens glandulifera TaxID=253017 RepID=UPI001FB0B539|nr:kinesin-like protein KIN-14R isoform X2 [Impatiens glandulifera]